VGWGESMLMGWEAIKLKVSDGATVLVQASTSSGVDPLDFTDTVDHRIHFHPE